MLLSPGRREPSRWAVIAVLGAMAFLIGSYVLLRYDGRSAAAGDAAAFTVMAQTVVESGQIVPEAAVYPNGYGFQVLLTFITQISGVSLSLLQTVAAALLICWLVIPAWLLAHEFLDSVGGATLAVVIVLQQPELLFTTLRGTHEKFTLGLMWLALFLLLRSTRFRRNLGYFAAHVLCFYVVTYAMISFNNLIANGFLTALALAVILNWAATRWGKTKGASSNLKLNRLIITLVSLLVISLIFTFFAYPPATRQFELYRSVWEKVRVLFLTIGSEGTTPDNPYGVVVRGWISTKVYFTVTLANWLLLALATLFWARNTLRWFTGREKPGERDLLLWAFFAAIAIQGGLAILADLGGALGSNLQVRLFPAFATIAAIQVAREVKDWQLRGNVLRRLWRSVFILAAGALMIASLFKATSEPVLSNNWQFYSPAEVRAIDWAHAGLAGQSLWTGFDARLDAGIVNLSGGASGDIQLDRNLVQEKTRDFLVSEIIRLRSQRINRSLPIEADSLQTYDNGEAQIHHARPRTPFQQ